MSFTYSCRYLKLYLSCVGFVFRDVICSQVQHDTFHLLVIGLDMHLKSVFKPRIQHELSVFSICFREVNILIYLRESFILIYFLRNKVAFILVKILLGATLNGVQMTPSF